MRSAVIKKLLAKRGQWYLFKRHKAEEAAVRGRKFVKEARGHRRHYEAKGDETAARFHLLSEMRQARGVKSAVKRGKRFKKKAINIYKGLKRRDQSLN